MAKRAAFSLVVLALILLLIECSSWAAGRLLQRKELMHREAVPPEQTVVRTYEEYLAKRDDLVGWPYRAQFGGDYFDAMGARRSPGFEGKEACLSLYGDSFTQGGEVDHEYAWGHVLSQQLGCRVANFGQGGYGTDQAYLRFKQNGRDEARVVALGHLPENILRNVTRCRDLYTYTMHYALKPRFVLDGDGRLELIPIPRLSEDEYLRFLGVKSPQLILDHEYFHPGGPGGVTRLQPPFTYAVLRNLGHFRMRAALMRRPPHVEFYAPDHLAGGLPLTAEILRSFARDAERDGRHPVVILFASKLDLMLHRRTGEWGYQPLLDLLDRVSLPYLHLGPPLEAYLADRELGEFFKPMGHYTEEGNRVVADIVHQYLRQRGLLDVIPGSGG
jgi:hypothetical protein